MKNRQTIHTGITIREYSARDYHACLALFDSNCPKYFSAPERELFADWLNKTDRASYSVMEREGEIIACGGIYHDPETNSVGMAWGMVRQNLHRQGHGRRLTEFRLEQMAEQFPTLAQRLGTSQHTFRFYEKMGFEVEKITRNGFAEGIDQYDMIKDPGGGGGSSDGMSASPSTT